MRNKNGKPELVTCRCQKEQIPLLVKGAQEAISGGMAVPSFDSFFLKMVALEPSLGRQVPINRALHLALERYGLTVQLMEAIVGKAREEMIDLGWKRRHVHKI
jgi:hypothetical protein